MCISHYIWWQRDVGDSQTSSSCHQHIASPTAVTVMDVTILKLWKLWNQSVSNIVKSSCLTKVAYFLISFKMFVSEKVTGYMFKDLEDLNTVE